MTGNELITITIEDGDKRISTRYCVLDADRFNGTKGEYHLLALDNLIKKFNDSKEKDIPWPDPLDRSEIKDSKEKCDQKFKDGIRYFQG